MSLNCATIEDEDGGTGTGAATKGGILFIVVNNSASLKQLNRNRIDESEGSTYLLLKNPRTLDRSSEDRGPQQAGFSFKRRVNEQTHLY